MRKLEIVSFNFYKKVQLYVTEKRKEFEASYKKKRQPCNTKDAKYKHRGTECKCEKIIFSPQFC